MVLRPQTRGPQPAVRGPIPSPRSPESRRLQRRHRLCPHGTAVAMDSLKPMPCNHLRETACRKWSADTCRVLEKGRTHHGRRTSNPKLQGSSCVANGDGVGAFVLWPGKAITSDRTLRVERAGTPFGRVSAFEHCGGPELRCGRQIPSSHQDRSGFVGRARNGGGDRETAWIHQSRRIL